MHSQAAKFRRCDEYCWCRSTKVSGTMHLQQGVSWQLVELAGAEQNIEPVIGHAPPDATALVDPYQMQVNATVVVSGTFSHGQGSLTRTHTQTGFFQDPR